MAGQVAEPEVARVVEHEIVGPGEGKPVALGVEPFDGAGFQRHSLDAWPTGGVTGASTVVADVDRAVGTQGGAIRASADVGNDRHGAIGCHSRQPPGLDLHHQHRAVGQRDRSFREGESLGEHVGSDQFHDTGSLPQVCYETVVLLGRANGILRRWRRIFAVGCMPATS